MRAKEKGWIRIGRLDEMGRRGMWYRLGGAGSVELCAGREGDDAYCIITHPTRALLEVLEQGAWAGAPENNPNEADDDGGES